MLHHTRTVFQILGAAVLIVLGTAGSAPGQADGDVDRVRREKAAIQRKIKAEKRRLDRFAERENTVIAKLRTAERELAEAKRAVDRLESEMAALDRKIEQCRSRTGELEERIEAGEAHAGRRMRALYKLNSLGKYDFLASADSINDFIRRKTALERILSQDRRNLARLEENRADLLETRRTLTSKKAEKAELERSCAAQVAELDERKRTRRSLLAAIRKKKALARAHIDAMKSAAKSLDRKIADMAAEIPEVRAAAAGDDSAPFTAFKGRLKLPVKGKIISFFGPHENTELDVVNFQNGIDIQAPLGRAIRAVRPGKVIYSDWFKGYGNMLIIDHGESYYTLYAHADKVYKRKGDVVDTGEAIATVGDTDSLKGAVLHFEIRHHGKSVDPMKWLQTG